MTSPDLTPVDEPPPKRQKVDSPHASTQQAPDFTTPKLAQGLTVKDVTHTQTVMSDTGFQPDREAEVGILHFVNSSNVGFTGILKQRYTDFLVNEIAPDGSVVYLTNDQAPKLDTVPKKNVGGSVVQQVNNENANPNAGQLKQEDKKGVAQDKTQDLKQEPEQDFKPEQAVVPEEKPKPAESASVPETAATSAPPGDLAGTSTTPHYMIAPTDLQLLESHFGAIIKENIIKMHDSILAKPGAKASVFGALYTDAITDRALRGRIHHDMRRIFNGHFETEVTSDSTIMIAANPPARGQREGGRLRNPNPRQQQNNPNHLNGKLGWQQLGGQHLHFSLYKENKDTMEVISFLAKSLQCKPRDFAFAGTKDRRAVTVQRVSVFRKYAPQLAKLNRDLRMARVGNFKHETQQLELGENQGNQFVITLRDCHFGDDHSLDAASRENIGRDVVSKAVRHIQDYGFINYYGLQRFGTFGIGTDEIGQKILKNNFKEAVDGILNFSQESLDAALGRSARPNDRIGRDDLDRAHAIQLFKSGVNIHKVLEKMPNKFSGEKAILQHLGIKRNESDYIGALLAVNRNLRTMYVHAYQSLVWNTVASERWARYGGKVIKGDLVIMETAASKAAALQDEVDESGEVVIRPAADDFAVTHDDIYERARPLTLEEAEGGKYTIFDVVLPTPGFDVEYPDNDIGDFYKEFMGSERGGGIDPADMRRKQKDFSLSGNYRKLIGQVGKDMSFEIKAYTEDNEQLVETDLEKLNKSRPQYNRSTQDGSSRTQDYGRNNGPLRDRNDRNDRNDRSNRGGRQSRGHDRRVDRTAERQPPAEANPQLSAWMNLPAQLAAEDKAHAEAAKLAKLIEEPINPHEVKQPIYKETFIETSADDEGRRTGVQTTKYVDIDGKEVTKEEAEARIASAKDAVLADALEKTAPIAEAPIVNDAMDLDGVPATKPIDIPVSRDVPAAAKESSSISDSSSEGGVALSVSNEPNKKRSATEISLCTTPPLNPAAAEFKTPGSAPTSTALETPIGSNAKDSTSPSLNPATSEFVNAPQPENTIAKQECEELDLTTKVPEVKIAVIIKFVLGTSQYATVALRELMKLGGVKNYKPDFSGGR